jgi:hypothetical protein
MAPPTNRSVPVSQDSRACKHNRSSVDVIHETVGPGAKRPPQRHDCFRRQGAASRRRSMPVLRWDQGRRSSPASRWRRARRPLRAQTRNARISRNPGLDTRVALSRARRSLVLENPRRRLRRTSALRRARARRGRMSETSQEQVCPVRGLDGSTVLIGVRSGTISEPSRRVARARSYAHRAHRDDDRSHRPRAERILEPAAHNASGVEGLDAAQLFPEFAVREFDGVPSGVADVDRGELGSPADLAFDRDEVRR